MRSVGSQQCLRVQDSRFGTHQVRIQSSTSDVFDGLLCRFGLLFLIDDRDHGNMNMQEIACASLSSKLSQCFDKWSVFDVTNSSPTCMYQLCRSKRADNLGMLTVR